MVDTLELLFKLNGQRIIVTGASGLLGAQHAEAIAAFGGRPVLLDIDEPGLERLASSLQDRFQIEVERYVVDITDEDSVTRAAQSIRSIADDLYGLINNAAVNPKVESNDAVQFSRLENFPLEQWNFEISVSLGGAFLCAKHFGQHIAESGGGAILNISSDLGVIAPDQRLYRKPGLPDHLQPVKPVTYSVIKSGLIGLTRYLSTYWPDRNVRCNTLCPGGVYAGQDEVFLNELTSRIPMGRMADTNEYQGAIVFMMSQASAYMNGATINMDGGRSVW